jgi:diguanylate cyclase (GGDEF)-like protein
MPVRRIRYVHLLTLFVSAAIIALSVLQLSASYFEAKGSLYETTFKLNYESAVKMSVTMGSLFRSMENALQGNAKHLAERAEAGGDLQFHVDHFMESNNFFNGLIVVDAEGNVLAASETLAGLKGTVLTDTTARKALETREPALSAPYRSTDGKLVVLMTYPIYDAEGRYNGYVGGTIHLTEQNVLNDIFGTGSVSELGSYSYVVDPSGTILYHPDPARLGDSEAVNAIVRKLMRGERGYAKVRNTRGKLFLAGYVGVAENGWGIVVQTPIEEIHSRARQVILKEIGYTLPFYALLLLVTIFMARKLSAPFSVLAKTAERLVAGYQTEEMKNPAFLSFEANQLHRTVMLAMDQLQKRAEHFLHESQTDPLTGLANRRTMNTWISEWMNEQKPFSLIMIDIDRFKSINDTYGHQTGDDVLRFFAGILRTQLRSGDCCCRYGGEEFAVLLPNTPVEGAFRIAERIRTKLESTAGPTGGPVTISCGVAAYPDDAETAQAVLEAADRALYAAKRAGRNRTVVYRQTGMEQEGK